MKYLFVEGQRLCRRRDIHGIVEKNALQFRNFHLHLIDIRISLGGDDSKCRGAKPAKDMAQGCALTMIKAVILWQGWLENNPFEGVWGSLGQVKKSI